MGGSCRALGLTLVEMLVAVAFLVVVMAVATRMFSTVRDVTGAGHGVSEMLGDLAVIERQLRADFSRLSPEGFLVIRCVAVRNNVHAPGPLLAPHLPPDAVIRADQVLFFVHGVESIQTLRVRARTNRGAQSTAARVYWGHAFQVAGGPGVIPSDDVNGEDLPDVVWALDPAENARPLVPWHRGAIDLVRTRYQRRATDPPGDYGIDGVFGPVAADQPITRRWLLTRQAVVLADDGGSPAVFMHTIADGGLRSTATILDAAVHHGRVDVAAGQLDDIRRDVVTGGGGPAVTPWSAQRAAMTAALFYVRAERAAPGMHRVDQALTAHVIAGGCSSFIVDWTYAGGVGATPSHRGVTIDPAQEQPWFGLALGDRGVHAFADHVLELEPSLRPQTVGPEDIEGVTPAGRAIEAAGAVVYEAVFGYNHATPLDPATGAPWPPDSPSTYTPWPTAIRVTMVLHDAGGRLERGREVQFVIDLP